MAHTARVEEKPRMLLIKLYPQFHPRSAFDVRDVVLANRKTPVSTRNADTYTPRYSYLNQTSFGACVR